MAEHSETTRGIAMACLDVTRGNMRQAVRLMASVYGVAVAPKTLRRWRAEGHAPDARVARELHQQLAILRIAAIAPLLEPLKQRVRKEINTGTARDVRDVTEALHKALLTLDPTAAPGGQRAMHLPQGSQDFVAWGPMVEGATDRPRSDSATPRMT